MNFKPTLVLLTLVIGVTASPARAAGAQQAVVVDQYSGGFKDDYLQELPRVRTYLPLAQPEISVQLGLVQYGHGFLHPVNVRFTDGAPAIAENPFFYVRPSQTADGAFSQDLMVNVEAYARRSRDAQWDARALRNAFYYATAQLILNDLSGGQTDKALPLWAQEGLCVYAASDGKRFVKLVGETSTRSKAMNLVCDLNRPDEYLTPREWANYYLAIQFIANQGSNALQGFVRNVVAGRSPADTVRDVMSMEWPDFESNVREYAYQSFLTYAPEDTFDNTRRGALGSRPDRQ